MDKRRIKGTGNYATRKELEDAVMSLHYESGHTLRGIARTVGIHDASVRRIIVDHTKPTTPVIKTDLNAMFNDLWRIPS